MCITSKSFIFIVRTQLVFCETLEFPLLVVAVFLDFMHFSEAILNQGMLTNLIFNSGKKSLTKYV